MTRLVRGRPGHGRRAGELVGVAVAAAAGVLIGAAGMAAVQDAPARPGDVALLPRAAPADPAAAPGPAPTGRVTSPPPEPAPADPDVPAVLLAWTQRRLDPGLAAAISADGAVTATSVVRGGIVDLVASRDAGGAVVDRPAAGWAIPLDAVAFDPGAHAAFVSVADRRSVADLAPGQALLGATSAALRRLAPGGVIDLASGGSVTVAGVVSDTAIGGAELAVDLATGTRLGVADDRFALASYAGDRGELEARLLAALPADTPVQFRGPGETPFLRHGDAVLPQALIKARFGEFAYRRGGGDGDGFDQDPAWQERNLVTADLPLIGPARCHRAIVEALAGALSEVAEANLAALIDPAGFAGCWNARTTRSGTSVSRHAWGVAVDLNFGANPTGLASVQDPRLVAIFDRWGFTDGSRWLVPDAGHFEFVSPPRG